MPAKTHQTSVVAIPPCDVWEPIQTIRRQHDRQVHRWMPHVNLLYPFVPRAQFEQVLPDLIHACQQVAAFDVTLSTFRSFTHRAGRGTIWLAPEPHDAWLCLQTTLQDALPAFDEQSRFVHGFTPHLSVGQVSSGRDLRQLLNTLQATWQPLAFRLTQVALIWRQADTPFKVAHWIDLADSTS